MGRRLSNKQPDQMHLQCGSNLVWILPRNQKTDKNKRTLWQFFLSQIQNEGQKTKKTGLYPSLCDFYPLNWNEDQRKKVLFDNFLVCSFIMRYTWTTTFEQRPNKLEKKVFLLTLYGGTLNFPFWEAKYQWGDSNYWWGTRPSYNLSIGYIFIHRLWALFHYYCSATVRNQHQMLTCKL